MKNTAIYITNVLILCAIVGCKIPALQPQPQRATLPNSFDTAASDTSNVAQIPWKTFFNDVHLGALIEEAIQNNPDLLAASQKIDLANAEVKAQRGALRPVVSGTVNPALRRFGLYTMDGAGNASTDIQEGKIVPTHLPDFLVGIQTSWEVDVWNKLKSRKKAAMLRFLASTEGKNVVLTNLIAEIALRYYDLIMLDNQLDVLNESVALQQNALEVVRIQKEAGRVNELAVKQFEAQILNAQSDIMATQQAIAENENWLNYLAGRFSQPITRNSVNALEQMLPPVQSGIPTQLLRNRPDIRQAEYELLACQADIDAARAAFYPSFTLTGGLGMQAFNPVLLTSPQSLAYNLIGGVTAPLFNKSALEAAYLSANATQREAFFNYQKSVLNAFTEVRNEMIKWNNLRQQQALKSREVTTLREAINISSELFTNGRATYLELLTAQQNTLAAQLELLEIKKAQLLNATNIYKALGGGWN
jgi:outer membrane protein, multidrug efflux system